MVFKMIVSCHVGFSFRFCDCICLLFIYFNTLLPVKQIVEFGKANNLSSMVSQRGGTRASFSQLHRATRNSTITCRPVALPEAGPSATKLRN